MPAELLLIIHILFTTSSVSKLSCLFDFYVNVNKILCRFDDYNCKNNWLFQVSLKLLTVFTMLHLLNFIS